MAQSCTARALARAHPVPSPRASFSTRSLHHPRPPHFSGSLASVPAAHRGDGQHERGGRRRRGACHPAPLARPPRATHRRPGRPPRGAAQPTPVRGPRSAVARRRRRPRPPPPPARWPPLARPSSPARGHPRVGESNRGRHARAPRRPRPRRGRRDAQRAHVRRGPESWRAPPEARAEARMRRRGRWYSASCLRAHQGCPAPFGHPRSRSRSRRGAAGVGASVPLESRRHRRESSGATRRARGAPSRAAQRPRTRKGARARPRKRRSPSHAPRGGGTNPAGLASTALSRTCPLDRGARRRMAEDVRKAFAQWELVSVWATFERAFQIKGVDPDIDGTTQDASQG